MVRWLLLLFAAAGCHTVFALQPPGDAAPSDAIVDAKGMGSWGAPVLHDEFPTTADDPTLTADQLELYFEFGGDIHRMARGSTDAPFSGSVRVDQLSDGMEETSPDVSADGLTMYLSRRAPTNFQLLVSTRPDRTDNWGATISVADLASARSDTALTTTADQLTRAFVRSTGTTGTDIFVQERTSVDDAWSTPERVDANSPQSDVGAMISADGLTLYFASNRVTRYRLYRATRATRQERFGTAEVIEEFDAANADDIDPWVSPDETRLFFVRTRLGVAQFFESRR